MKKIKIVVIFIATIAFIMIPLPAADIHLRFHFKDTIEGTYALYYSTTSSGFSQEQCIVSDISETTNGGYVSFCLNGNLEEQLTGIRLDFPAGEQLICISEIALSSAGIVQKQFNPCKFFSDENLANQNDISAVSTATAQDKVYIATIGKDPYMILSSDLTEEIRDGYSHLRLTRLGICLFATACYFMYKKNLFSKES